MNANGTNMVNMFAKIAVFLLSFRLQKEKNVKDNT